MCKGNNDCGMPWPTSSVRTVKRIDRPRPDFRPLTPSYPQGVVMPQCGGQVISDTLIDGLSYRFLLKSIG